ncbi:MAG: hypothetical protein ABI357_05120 [Granulicella sp.]
MKLKNYFRKIEREGAVSKLKSDFSKDFGPLYQKPKRKLSDYMRLNPKRSFAVMILILVVNFIGVAYFDTKNAGDNKINIGNFKHHITTKSSSENGIPMNVENITKLKRIEDSLRIYVNKPFLTHDDSSRLRNILTEYMSIRPKIFEKNPNK